MKDARRQRSVSRERYLAALESIRETCDGDPDRHWLAEAATAIEQRVELLRRAAR